MTILITPHELPNDLRLRILEIRKHWKNLNLGWRHSISVQEIKLWQSSQNLCQSRCETILVLFNLTRFIYFVVHILSDIA